MQVPSRGTNLQGTFQSAATPAPGPLLDVQVDLRGVDWLQFKGELSMTLLDSILVVVMNLDTVSVSAVLILTCKNSKCWMVVSRS